MPFETLAKAPEPKEVVEKLVHWLNEGGRCPAIFAPHPMTSDLKLRQLLAEYVDCWLSAGCQLRRWNLRRQFEKIVAPIVPSQHKNQPVSTKTDWTFYTNLDKVAFGVEDSEYEPPKETEEEDEERIELEDSIYRQITREKAAQIFLTVITSRYYRSLGRCARCNNLYFNLSNQAQKKYCSQRCASFDSSARSSSKQREARREEQIALLQKAAKRLSRLSAAQLEEITDVTGWLKKETGFSRHFVTRAINKGLLTVPTKGEHR
jgi:hypothetical protein